MYNFFASLKRSSGVTLYVLWGQSNQEGSPVDPGNLPEYLTGPQDSIYIYNNNQYETLEAGVNSLGNPWGPEMEMGYRLREHYNTKIYISKYAVGGTSLGPTAGQDWLPSLDERYVTALAHYNASLAKLQSDLPGETIIVKHLWNQGEQDMDSDTNSTNYEVNETALFNQIISDINPTQILSARTSIKVPKNVTYRERVRTAKVNNASVFDIVYLIDTDSFTVEGDQPSGLHFDANGLVQLGEAYYNELIKI